MWIMAFNTIIINIMVIHIDLLYHICFPSGIQGMAQTAGFSPGWFINTDTVGISGMVKTRSMACFA